MSKNRQISAGPGKAGKSQGKAAEPRQKRLCVMLPRFARYGGVEQFGVRLAEALAGKGYHVDFICSRIETEAPPGVNVLCTGRPRGSQFLKQLWFCLQAEKLRSRGNYDCSISLGKTLRQDILRVGGGPLRTFWRLSSRAYPSLPERWWKGLRRRLSPANRLTLFLEKRQYSGGTRLIAVSHLVRDWIIENYPHFNARDIDLVYNRPDLSRFYAPSATDKHGGRVLFDMPEDVVAIGTASSNFRLKGVGPLIRALALLPPDHHLYIAGGRGHKAYDDLAQRLGVSQRVHFLGTVERMAEFYHALDIFVLPTFYDACSNAVLEALASGIGVLSSKSNGSAFFLKPQQIIDDPANPRELAEKISAQRKASRSVAQFKWPQGLAVGIEGVIDVIEDFLRKKPKKT